MSEYEITYTSDAEMAEEARVQLDAAVDEHIRELSGSSSYASPHIPRRLFYPIKKKRAAGLRMLQIELSTEKIDDVRTFLKKQAGVLRFAILQTARRPEVPAALMEQIRDKRGGRPSTLSPNQKPAAKMAAKPMTQAEVDESIEKALTEEVK